MPIELNQRAVEQARGLIDNEQSLERMGEGSESYDRKAP
jgi:hypothetical protein